MFTGVSHVDSEYESSRMMISAQMRTGHRVVANQHCVTVAFLTPFSVCIMPGIPYLPDGGSHCRVKVRGVFCKNVYPLSEGYVCVCPPLYYLSSTCRIECQRKMCLG